MAQTLIARLRGVLSSKDDSYFDNEDLLDYLNAGKDSVFGAAVNKEQKRLAEELPPIRALNMLRVEHIENALTFTTTNQYSKAEFVVDGEFSDLLYVGADVSGNPVALTEIFPNSIQQLDWGVLKPSDYRGYYYFYTTTPDTTPVNTLRVYLKNTDAGTTITIIYLKAPAPLTIDSDNLVDLPDRLINAVIMRAGLLAATQEMRENTTHYSEIYKLELGENLW